MPEQDRIAIVLVRARNPSNIGAVARAMHDLAYTDLRVVNAFPVPFEAAKSAVDASSVLTAATTPTSLAEAIADCTLVLGTTAVGDRALEHPLYTLTDAVPILHSHLAQDPSAKIALLFGSEKTGLSNDELSHCHALLTIPMNTHHDERHLSMNLGQAVAICLYAIAADIRVPHSSQSHRDEWVTTTPQATTEARVPHSSQPYRDEWVTTAAQAPTKARVPHSSQPYRDEWVTTTASAADLERLTTLLLEVIQTTGYSRRHPANSREAVLRRLTRRMALASNDAQVWTGILRQILHALEQKPAADHRTTESKL